MPTLVMCLMVAHTARLLILMRQDVCNVLMDTLTTQLMPPVLSVISPTVFSAALPMSVVLATLHH